MRLTFSVERYKSVNNIIKERFTYFISSTGVTYFWIIWQWSINVTWKPSNNKYKPNISLQITKNQTTNLNNKDVCKHNYTNYITSKPTINMKYFLCVILCIFNINTRSILSESMVQIEIFSVKTINHFISISSFYALSSMNSLSG